MIALGSLKDLGWSVHGKTWCTMDERSGTQWMKDLGRGKIFPRPRSFIPVLLIFHPCSFASPGKIFPRPYSFIDGGQRVGSRCRLRISDQIGGATDDHVHLRAATGTLN